ELREENRNHPGTHSSVPKRLSDDENAEKAEIVRALQQTDGNRTQAAKLLETSRVTLWKKIKKYGLDD
ncbi:MAG: helix-turn-helix domain-containing protein, partial [Planctomycetaceae bacterium]|nr:helix-turn-helix domain-containing protein [Planctomycetaceae bacterium]